MSVETVQIKYVNQPKQPGWKGSIVDTQGRRITVEPNELGLFQPGGTYSIMTSAGTNRQGQPYIKFAGMAGPGGALAPSQSTPQPQRTNGYAKPANGNGNDSRMIFITGVVGRAMGSGNFSIGDMRNLTLEAMACAALASGERADEPPPHESDAPF